MTLEELQALLQEKEALLEETSSKVQALERTRAGLLGDLQKRKGV
jgi:hypothetical protein